MKRRKNKYEARLRVRRNNISQHHKMSAGGFGKVDN